MAKVPDTIRVFHGKNREEVFIPLYDDDGSEPWPELMARLDASKRNGVLMVLRDKPDRNGHHLPFKRRHFASVVAKIRKHAGIEAELKFMALRHGGYTEGGDAGLTDAQKTALAGHLSNMNRVYDLATLNKLREGARRRRDLGTKRGNLSE